MAAQGYAFKDTTAVQLTDQNTYRWNGSAWVPAATLYALVGGTYQDILYHAPSYPPVNTKWSIGTTGKIYHTSVSKTALGVNISTHLKFAGYDVAATKASGLKFKITFKRGSDNASYWVTIQLWTASAAIATASSVNANSDYSFTIAAKYADTMLYQAWSDAAAGGGGQGRNFSATGVSIEVVK